MIERRKRKNTKKKSSNTIHADMADYPIKIYTLIKCMCVPVCVIRTLNVSNNFSMTLVHPISYWISNYCFFHKIAIVFSFFYKKKKKKTSNQIDIKVIKLANFWTIINFFSQKVLCKRNVSPLIYTDRIYSKILVN